MLLIMQQVIMLYVVNIHVQSIKCSKLRIMTKYINHLYNKCVIRWCFTVHTDKMNRKLNNFFSGICSLFNINYLYIITQVTVC